MARKRLSDLLREEGQKAEGDTKAAEPINQPSQVKKSKQKEEAVPVTAEVIAAQAEQVEEFVSDLRSAAAEPDSTITLSQSHQAEMEETIAQLKAELDTAHQIVQRQEAALKVQIADLQSQLADQETALQTLQVEAQQAEQQSTQLKAELESAKQMILQLSQVNGTPAQSKQSAPQPQVKGTLAQPKQSAPQPLPSSRAAEPELEPNKTQLVMPSAKSAALDRPKLHELELRKVLEHPIRPGSLPPMSSERPGSLPPMSSESKPAEREEVKLTDADVGWMD